MPKKAEAKATTDPGSKPDFDTIMAQFWAAFGVGANKFIDADCYEVAKKKGYIANIKRRLPSFADRKVLDRTLRCCIEAGQQAALIAMTRKELTISGKTFLEAIEIVEHQQNERIANSPKLKEMIANNVYGGVC